MTLKGRVYGQIRGTELTVAGFLVLPRNEVFKDLIAYCYHHFIQEMLIMPGCLPSIYEALGSMPSTVK